MKAQVILLNFYGMQQQMLEWVMLSALMEKFILLPDIHHQAMMLVKVIRGQLGGI